MSGDGIIAFRWGEARYRSVGLVRLIKLVKKAVVKTVATTGTPEPTTLLAAFTDDDLALLVIDATWGVR